MRARSGSAVLIAATALLLAACSSTVTGNGQAGVTVIRGGVPTVVDPSEVSPSETTTTVTSTVTSAAPSTTTPAPPVAIPDNGNGYTFMETRSGKTRCRVSETGAGCQLRFDPPGPKTESGDTANGVNVGSDGVLTYVLGDIGVANPAPLDYATYTARGWTIEASEAGTRFTNQSTGHGMVRQHRGRYRLLTWPRRVRLTVRATIPPLPDPQHNGGPMSTAPLAADAAVDTPSSEAPHEVRERRRQRALTAIRIASPFAVLALWQLGSALGLLPQDKLPAPSLIAEAGWDVFTSGELGSAILASAQRVVIGLGLGILIGVGLGLLVGLSKVADAVLDPNMQALRALPLFGLIPLFILWFGIGEEPKILLVTLGAVFPLYLNTSAAIRQVDPKLLENAKVLGFSRLQTIRELIVPSAMPQILVGLRQSLAIAWLSLIVAEQIAASSGLGYLINNARDFLRTDVVFFGLIVYAALGLITDVIVRALERYTTRYQVR